MRFFIERIVLVSGLIVMLFYTLCPPWVIENSSSVLISKGFHFLFDYPFGLKHGITIHWSVLILQWFSVLLIMALTLYLTRCCFKWKQQ